MSKTHPKNIIRVEILAEKGQEELFTDRMYQLVSKGIWLEEKGDSVMIKCYPEKPESFCDSCKHQVLKLPV